MGEETKEELLLEVKMNKCQEKQRTISDSRYALQIEFSLVQKIVFALITLIVMGVVGAIINSSINTGG
jgi:hypothetical protein